jgi:hypothetical protein
MVTVSKMTTAFAARMARCKPTKVPIGYSILDLEEDVMLLGEAFDRCPMPIGYNYEAVSVAIKNGESCDPAWLHFHSNFGLNRKYLTEEYQERLKLWIACYRGDDWWFEGMEYEIQDIDPNQKKCRYVCDYIYGNGFDRQSVVSGSFASFNTYGATEDDMDNPNFWINL